MGGLEESYVTRKPMNFTLIVLVVILLVLTPIYFYMKYAAKANEPAGEMITESYDEVNYWFSPDSDLSEKDKKTLFKINYEGNFVQWKGNIAECTPLDGIFRVGVSHKGTDFPDVLFRTEDDCTHVELGQEITYTMRLLEWKVNSFIGEDGSISGLQE